MDEYDPHAIANRNEPIPVISPPKGDPKRHEQLQQHQHQHQRSGSASGRSIQDRLFTKFLQQMFPVEEKKKEGDGDAVLAGEKAAAEDPRRPGFSLPLMTQNFRRFNARIGIVFAFQNQIERLLTWRKASHTISFQVVYSFVCLDPHILSILPIAAILVYVMVPAFLARHPPPPSSSTSSTMPYYSYEGPALAPPKTIEPASETSKDFFRNLRDLQNCMADFSDLHDSIISMFAPVTDFSNEKLASVAFLLLSVTAVLLFPAAHLLPWRYILLVGGNVVILSNHPGVQEFVQNLINDFISETTDQPSLAEKEAQDLFGISLPSSPSATMSALGPLAEISLDSYTEEREVEVFELQFWSPDPYAESRWEHFIFGPVPHDPLSPMRIAGDRPRGCRFFEDVQPPSGWAWKNKKWELDLDCREWVVERMITGVGFEIPGNGPEGDIKSNDEIGGWVWDLPLKNTHYRDEGEAVTLSPTYDHDSTPVAVSETGNPTTTKAKNPATRDWEEESSVESFGIGEWRRRRWVRLVNRVSVEE